MNNKKVLTLRSAGIAFLFCIYLFPIASVYAQNANCTDELTRAEQAYTRGSFDETISLVDQCLNKQNLSETDRRLAFRLKGLSYIGKGLEGDARDAVRRLLEIIPEFNADPIQDPPAFVQMIEEVRNELDSRVANPEPAETQVTRQPRRSGFDDNRNRLENWYTNWGLGIPFISYPDVLAEVLDALEDLGVSNTALMFDLFGFYWPIGEQAMVGVNMNAWGDRYEEAGESIQITAITFGPSLMYFVSKRIGDGVFVRAEIGASRLAFDGSTEDTITSDWGFGGLIGGGFGIPVSRETRILIHLNYSIRVIESDNYGNLGLGVTGLF